jgi:hypothetical protein
VANKQLKHMTETDESIQEPQLAVRGKETETSMIRMDRVEMLYERQI